MEITDLVKTQLIQTYRNLVGDLIGTAPKIISGIILSGVISVRDIDWFNRMGVEVPADGTDW